MSPPRPLTPSWWARSRYHEASRRDTHMTMVCVTHEVGFAREVADRAVLIDGGVIVEDCPPAIFFSNPTHSRTKQFLSKIL